MGVDLFNALNVNTQNVFASFIMPDFLSIPGNIRQQYMPFTIEGPTDNAQVFSFKDVAEKGYPKPCAQIHPFSRWLKNLIQNDSSIQYTHGPDGKKKVDLATFLDEIPAIQIREYVPDAKLTQTFKWFSYFKKGFDAALSNLDGKSFDFKSMKEKIGNIMENIGKTMKDLTSGDAPLLAKVVGGLAHFYQDKGYNIGADNGFAVLFLPFIMYYRLTTTHTNNVYELPFSMQNEIMKSDGTYGWTSTQSDFGVLDAVPEKVGNTAIAKMLLGNTIKVNMMPSFQPTGETKGETFTINIDLINDTDEAAKNNFLMCHTLFGNNRWLQYGFVQAGASLYDVKLPGANRYFMCAAQFSCKGKGAFRTPSDAVCEAIAKCANPKKTFAGELKNGSLKEIAEQMQQARADSIINNYVYNSTESDSNSSEVTSMSRRDEGYDMWKMQQAQMQAEFAAATKLNGVNCSSSGFIESPKQQTQLTQERLQQIYHSPQESSFGKILPENKAGVVFPGQKEAYIQASKVYTERVKETENIKSYINKYDSEVKAADVKITEADKIINGPYSQEEKIKAQSAKEDALQDKANAQDKLNDYNGTGQSAENALTNAENRQSGAELAFAKAREPLDAALGATEKAKTEHEAYLESATVTSQDIKKLIKIPDVYSLTLTFNSLLPDNFNNYLYGFRAGNLDPIENYAAGTVDELGVFEKLVQQLEAAIKAGG